MCIYIYSQDMLRLCMGTWTNMIKRVTRVTAYSLIKCAGDYPSNISVTWQEAKPWQNSAGVSLCLIMGKCGGVQQFTYFNVFKFEVVLCTLCEIQMTCADFNL